MPPHCLKIIGWADNRSVSGDKIQISLLLLRRGALSILALNSNYFLIFYFETSISHIPPGPSQSKINRNRTISGYVLIFWCPFLYLSVISPVIFLVHVLIFPEVLFWPSLICFQLRVFFLFLKISKISEFADGVFLFFIKEIFLWSFKSRKCSINIIDFPIRTLKINLG